MCGLFGTLAFGVFAGAALFLESSTAIVVGVCNLALLVFTLASGARR